jgi:hypothetical protein
MIEVGYSINEILEFIQIFKEYLVIHQAVMVFVKKDRIRLLKWAELQPNYVFDINFYGVALTYDAFTIAVYLKNKERVLIERNIFKLP